MALFDEKRYKNGYGTEGGHYGYFAKYLVFKQ